MNLIHVLSCVLILCICLEVALSATRMNMVLKYAIGLDLLNCHAKFRGDTISRSRDNDV